MAQNHKQATHSASKRARPASKKAAAKRSTAGPRSRRGTVIFDPTAPISPLALETQRVFKKGVRAQMADLAKKGVSTVVVVNGQILRGVPRLENGRYVIKSGARGKAVSVKATDRARK